MKLINKTKTYQTDFLKGLIDFINKDLNVEVNEIEFKTTRKLFHGTYYFKKKRISIRLNPNYNYPYKVEYNRKTKNLNYYNGYLDFLLLNHYETLIHVLAHELRHCWQEQNRKNRSNWIYNSYGKFSNKDADSFAIRKTREFRRKTQTLNNELILNNII